MSFEDDFPPPEQATPEGLLAIGGGLGSERLLCAYRRGIFPWFKEDQAVLWWSPDPRALLLPGGFRVSRSLARELRKQRFAVTMDHAFGAVIEACAAHRRDGTWIGRDMIEAYCRLHDLGYAHSVEVWREQSLAGGLYGISLGRAFFGESMFSIAPNASKVALAHLVQQTAAWDFHFIDCQLPSAHLQSLGVVNVARRQFIKRLERALQYPDRVGSWRAQLSLRPFYP